MGVLSQPVLGADLVMVGVCLAAAYTGVVKLDHAAIGAKVDPFKLNFAGLALGVGAWSAQLIGILERQPLQAIALAIWPILGSLAISLLGVGLAVRVLATARALSERCVGGAIIGATFVALQILALAAASDPHWTAEPITVLAGAALTIAIGALAGGVPRGWGVPGQALRALTFTFGFGVGHAVSLQALGGHGLKGAPPMANAIVGQAVGLVSAVVLAMCIWAVNRQARRRLRDTEAQHLRALADAVLEGLVIFDGEAIVATNRAFDMLMGPVQPELAPTPFRPEDLVAVRERLGSAIETALLTPGEAIPVELVASSVFYNGVSCLAVAVRDLRSRRIAEDQIRFLAHNDTLTGLLNRSSFAEKLSLDLKGQRRADDGLAVLYLDLDRFKQVNDLFGHASGDLVLREVALRIRGLLGPYDGFARLGGDEFAIIRRDAVTPEGLDAFCKAALAAIEPPITIGEGRTAMVGASLGVALFPDDGRTAEALVSAADAALYEAKTAGRNTYRFFEASLGEALLARQRLEQDLRHAVDGRRLRVVYQPQTHMSDRRIEGYEALVRWDHPVLGPISPDRFIPVAEESGLILELGEWVLREACAAASHWPGQEVVSVNLSAVQLHSNALPATVHTILIQTGLSPKRLELEITETALISNATQALHVLRQLKALGVSIAMDDFGTGFSSLSNLRNYPIDTIKIDGSFVRGVDQDPQAATIVRAVLGLGSGLGLKVIAEGVETRNEEAFLLGEGCDHAQGFFYGAPASTVPELRVSHG